jgi:hypothetical protein
MVSREWFMLDVRSGDPEAFVARLFAEGFEAFFPKVRAAALFPGHVFVNADPEIEGSRLRCFDPAARFVTNEVNRPMCVPSEIVVALKDGDSEAGGTLRDFLAAMAPEYRMESLRNWFHPAAIRS